MPIDPAQQAAAVRSLARHAHRLLREPNPCPAEALALVRRIDRLQDQARDRTPGELGRWLEGLRRRVEVRLRSASPPTSAV